MLHTGNVVVDHLLTPFILLFFVVAAITGIALGVCLIVGSTRTFQVLGRMNRWISLRSTLKPMETPRDIGKAVYGHRRWFGIAFMIGGAFAIFMLLAKVEVAAVAAGLGSKGSPAVLVIVESLKWILVAGGVLALLVGFMLTFSTDALRAFEGRLNRWTSTRQLGRGADTMHLALDHWVETFPRTAGSLLVVGAAIVLIASIIVWLTPR